MASLSGGAFSIVPRATFSKVTFPAPTWSSTASTSCGSMLICSVSGLCRLNRAMGSSMALRPASVPSGLMRRMDSNSVGIRPLKKSNWASASSRIDTRKAALSDSAFMALTNSAAKPWSQPSSEW